MKTGNKKKTGEIEECCPRAVTTAFERHKRRLALKERNNQPNHADGFKNDRTLTAFPTYPPITENGAQHTEPRLGRNVTFAKYLELRSKGKSIIEVVAERKIPFEEAQKFESQYLQLRENNRSYELFEKNKAEIRNLVALKDLAKRDGIDLPDLLNELKGSKSSKEYLAARTGLKAEIQDLQNQLSDPRSEYHELSTRKIPSLRNEAEALKTTITVHQSNLRALKIEEQERQRAVEGYKHQIRGLQITAQKMSEQTREAAMKVLQEFLQNYNRLVEFVFISILLALSRTDRYKLFWTLDQIATIGTVDAKEVLKVYRIELCMAVNYLDNFLREVGMKMIPHEDDNQGNELK